MPERDLEVQADVEELRVAVGAVREALVSVHRRRVGAVQVQNLGRVEPARALTSRYDVTKARRPALQKVPNPAYTHAED